MPQRVDDVSDPRLPARLIVRDAVRCLLRAKLALAYHAKQIAVNRSATGRGDDANTIVFHRADAEIDLLLSLFPMLVGLKGPEKKYLSAKQ